MHRLWTAGADSYFIKFYHGSSVSQLTLMNAQLAMETHFTLLLKH